MTQRGDDQLPAVVVPRSGPAPGQPRLGAVEQTLSMRNALNFLRGAQARGIDLAPLLHKHGIAPIAADAPPSRVAIPRIAAVLRDLQHTMRDEFVGLGQQPVRRGSFALAMRQMVFCPTLLEALQAGFGVYRLACADFSARLRVQQHGGAASITLVPRRGAPAATFLESAFLYWTVGVASWLMQRRIPVNEVWLRGAGLPPGYRACDGQPVFGVPEHFHDHASRLSFDLAWLAEPVAVDVVSLPRFLADAPAGLLAPFRQRSSVGEQVRLRLHAQLGNDMPSLEQTAWSLRITPHSLRRRLAEEGRSFLDIKNELRRDAAIDLLVHSSLKLEDIAERLGFSESSTLHRSFKLGTGLSPGEYRRAHWMEAAPSMGSNVAAAAAAAAP